MQINPDFYRVKKADLASTARNVRIYYRAKGELANCLESYLLLKEEDKDWRREWLEKLGHIPEFVTELVFSMRGIHSFFSVEEFFDPFGPMLNVLTLPVKPVSSSEAGEAEKIQELKKRTVKEFGRFRYDILSREEVEILIHKTLAPGMKAGQDPGSIPMHSRLP